MTRLPKALVLRELHRLSSDLYALANGHTAERFPPDVARAYREAASMVLGLETVLTNTDECGVNAVTGDCLC